MSLEAELGAERTYLHGPSIRSNSGKGRRDSGPTYGRTAHTIRTQRLRYSIPSKAVGWDWEPELVLFLFASQLLARY